MTIWKPSLAGDTPLYLAIADAMASDIKSGTLRPGQQLPTQRQLATALGLALTTVTRAYREAERRRLVTGEIGRGTFVRPPRSGTVASPEHGAIDLRANAMVPWAHIQEITQLIADLAQNTNPSDLFAYQPAQGNANHREGGVLIAERAGLVYNGSDVLVTAGAQHAILVTFATLAQPGDQILTESLTYGGMKSVANLLRLQLQGLPMDQEGIEPDAFEHACKTGVFKALYSMPTLQNPTTTLMSEQRRQIIATIAQRYAMPVVEDDSYGFLVPRARPMAYHIPDQTFYLASVSKSITPGLRISYLLSPRRMVDRLAAAISSTVHMVSPLLADVVTELIREGTADDIAAWKRDEAAERQSVALRRLPPNAYVGHPSAHHGWLTLPDPWTTAEFVEQAKLRGVLVSPVDDFVTDRNHYRHAVRISAGPPQDREEWSRAVDTLAGILEAPPLCSAPTV